MKSLIVAVLAIPALAACADDAAPIVKVGLYKNGLAVVTRRVTPDSTGTAVVDGSAKPAYGTFWHSAEQPVTVTRTAARDGVTVSFRAAPDFAPVLAEVEKESSVEATAYTVGEKDRVFTASGKLIANGNPDNANLGYGNLAYDKTLTLELKSGSKLNIPQALKVSLKGAASGESWRFTGTDKPFDVEYLSSGASWTPSYRLALGETGKGTLFMSADVRNELDDWKDAELSLISGFPNLKFANVPSLLGGGVDFAAYKNAVEAAEGDDQQPRYYGRRAKVGGVMSQSVMRNYAPDGYAAPSAAAYDAVETGAGADIHYREVGKVTLGKGETLTLPLGAKETQVERLVDWDLNDRRDFWGRLVNEEFKPELWDAVKVRNPFGFPLTTAPMEVVEEGRLLGQNPCAWTNPGDEAIVKVTKALSVKGSYEERGDGKSISSKMSSLGANERFSFNDHDYRKETVTATMKLTNFRKEAAKLRVKKTFSGELVKSEVEPTKRHDPPPADSRVNAVHDLTWEFELKAGESREITFTYWLWVMM